MPISTVGLIQAIIDSIAESDNEIGGLNQTRLVGSATKDTPLGAPFTWDGSSIVLTPSTSGLVVGDWIRLVDGGLPFQVESIVVDTSITITVPSGSTVPTGPEVVSVVATLAWNGTTTVTATDTSEIGIGQWIRLDSDGQWFEITDLDPNVSVTITNPLSLTIPSGVTASSRSKNPVTALVLTSLTVETVDGWNDIGKLTVEGVVYDYSGTSLVPSSLNGISHSSDGEIISGLKKNHKDDAPVTDITKIRSGIELARRALLVEYAEGGDLNALGRNLGVFRFPFLSSDDVFRELIKALAYNPKGTMFGLELILDAMLGSGNYELFEDLLAYPNTVFIRNLQGAFITEGKEGKAILTGTELQPATSSTTVDIDYSVTDRGSVHGVTLADENHLSDFRSALPSAELIAEYPGDAGTQAWYYDGNSEVADVAQLTNNLGIQISDTGAQRARYERVARVQPESYVSLNVLTYVSALSTIVSSVQTQWGAEIEDGDKVVSWGIDQAGGGQFSVGLTSGGDAFVAGSAIDLPTDEYFSVEIRKYGTETVELYVNGSLVQIADYSLFTTSSAGRTTLRFGSSSTTGSSSFFGRVKQVGFFVKTLTDYWGGHGTSGDVNIANPTRLDVNIAGFFLAPTDVGKRVEIRNASVANAQGGNNNGVYQISSIVSAPSDQIELAGPSFVGATVNADLVSVRVRVSTEGPQFKFPDDLGKTLVISGSDQGNNGSYTIDKLLDSDSLVDLESFATILPQTTNVCEVTVATFVSESGLTYRVDPAFETESNIEWEASDLGSVSILGTTLTLRQALPSLPAGVVAPAPTIVLGVRYSSVLSAQVLLDTGVVNEIIQTLPDLLFAYYPFYLSDPLAFIRNYVDEVTAAGVIPEFLES